MKKLKQTLKTIKTTQEELRQLDLKKEEQLVNLKEKLTHKYLFLDYLARHNRYDITLTLEDGILSLNIINVTEYKTQSRITFIGSVIQSYADFISETKPEYINYSHYDSASLVFKWKLEEDLEEGKEEE